VSKAYGRIIKHYKEEYTDQDMKDIEEETNKLIEEFRNDGVLIFADRANTKLVSAVKFKYRVLPSGIVDIDTIQVQVR
jgi:hypothetical protein